MKRLLFGVLLSSLLLEASSVTVPVSVLYTKKYEACMQHVMNEYDSIKCSEQELKRADMALNEAYQKAKEKIQKFRQKDLLKMQRAWIVYRDAKCGFLYHKESGSAGLGAASECMLDETLKRMVELKNIY